MMFLHRTPCHQQIRDSPIGHPYLGCGEATSASRRPLRWSRKGAPQASRSARRKIAGVKEVLRRHTQESRNLFYTCAARKFCAFRCHRTVAIFSCFCFTRLRNPPSPGPFSRRIEPLRLPRVPPDPKSKISKWHYSNGCAPFTAPSLRRNSCRSISRVTAFASMV